MIYKPKNEFLNTMIVDLYSINQQEDFNSNDLCIIAANKNIEKISSKTEENCSYSILK